MTHTTLELIIEKERAEAKSKLEESKRELERKTGRYL